MALVELASKAGQQEIASAIRKVGTDVINAGTSAKTAAEEAERSATIAADSAESVTTMYNAIVGSYGYPFTAATAADMTDTTKIYVYTGSEDGYTNGNWYYYDGNAWVSGGIFNSTAFETDHTLSISNEAADAKITGVRLGEIAEDNIMYRRYGVTFKTNKGTWSAGVIELSIPYGLKEFCVKNGTFTYDDTALTQNNINVTFWDGETQVGSSNYISKENWETYFSVPDGADKIKLQVYTNHGTANNTSVTVSELSVIAEKFGIVETKLGDSVINGVTEENTLWHIKNKTFFTAKSSYSRVVKNLVLPAGAKRLNITVGNFAYDDTELTSSRVGVSFLDVDGQQTGDTKYINNENVTISFAIPTDATNVWVSVYTNFATAYNNTVTVSELYVLADDTADDTQVRKQFINDVYIQKVKAKEIAALNKNDVTGVNILAVESAEFKQGVISSSTGSFVSNSGVANSATPERVPVSSNTEYVLSWKWNSLYQSVRIHQYDEDDNWLGSTYVVGDSWTVWINCYRFKTAATAKYIRISFWTNTEVIPVTSYEDFEPKEVQLQISGTVTPYKGKYDFSHYVDFEKARNPKLTIPDYYHKDGYLESKVNAIKDLMLNASGDYDAFFFITDMHWGINQKHSPALIRYIAKRLMIPRLFNGGDMYDCWGPYGDDECNDTLKSALSNGVDSSKIYNVVGNHEYKKTYMTDANVWFFLNSDKTDIVPGDVGRSYYYADNTVQKIRYIVLNDYTDAGNEPVKYFEQAQQDWFANVALNVPSGWKIIVFTHSILGVSGSTGAIWYDEGITEPIYSIVDNYSGNGEIVAIIAGHTHADKISFTPGGVPVIITTCDKNTPWVVEGVDQEPWLAAERPSGTIYEQAFDVMIIDKRNRIISAVRIGGKARNGIDSELGELVEIRQVNFRR